MSVAAQVQQAFSVALYQPDIAGNTGAILRLAACFGFQVELIGPAGFNTSERAFRRAGMDYLELARLQMHVDWAAFERWRRAHMRRLILFSTKSARAYAEFAFEPNDLLLFGRESAGVPEEVHQAADHCLTIPMPGGGRSLNLAMSVAIASGEA